MNLPPCISRSELVSGYPVLAIQHPACTARVALHGAHLMEWTPAGQKPVLYMSPQAIFEGGKPIRGGVPVCWPWFGDLRRNWGWLLALGIVFVLLGIAGLFLTVAVTLATVLVIGIFLIGGGVLLAIQTLKAKGWQSRWWQLLIALIYIAAGVLIVADPVMASLTLTLFIAAFIFAAGILRLMIAWQHRGEPQQDRQL